MNPKVEVEIGGANGIHLRAGQVFTDAHGRQFRATKIQHVLSPRGVKTIVEATALPLRVPYVSKRKRNTFTGDLRTLLKLGAARDILLVCVENRSPKAKRNPHGNRIYIAELDHGVKPSDWRWQTDAEYARDLAKTYRAFHRDYEVKLGRVVGTRNGRGAIRRLAGDLAAAGFVVLMEDRSRKQSVGLHLQINGKRRRLIPQRV